MFTTTTPRRRIRVAAASFACSMALVACGGSDGSADEDEPGTPIDVGADADSSDPAGSDGAGTGDLDTSDLDTSGLDEGQQEILEDVMESGLGDDAPRPWIGVRLVTTSRSTTITDEFPEEVGLPAVDIVGSTDNHQQTSNSAVANDAIWVAGRDTLHRFVLADGSESATVSIADVLPGDDQAEFVSVAGDANGVFALAKGFDIGLIIELDAELGTIVATHDVTALGLRPVQLAVGATHVAVSFNGSVPLKVLDRATGAITDIGNDQRLKGVAVAGDRLIISNAPDTASGAHTYDVHALADGTLRSSGQLPYDSALQVFGDRIVQQDVNQADPPPIVEVDPQGAPLSEVLPGDVRSVVDYVESDGTAYALIGCCAVNEFGSDLDFVAIDMATGQLLGGETISGRYIVLPG
ncbi:MAG: hypothetical protein AAFP84_20890 [Actinomycetota bacterium]